MDKKAYDDYLEELDYILIKLGKEFAEISTEFDTLAAPYGGLIGFYDSITKDTCTYDDVLHQIRGKIRTQVDVIKRIHCVRDRIKDVERNKEKIFIKKEPGYELLRGE